MAFELWSASRAEAEKQADKESENDSGREEEDGSLEDWREKELAGECSTEEAAVEAVPAKRRMALLKIGQRRSWPGNASLKRQLSKQFQPKRRRMALLEIGQRRS